METDVNATNYEHARSRCSSTCRATAERGDYTLLLFPSSLSFLSVSVSCEAFLSSSCGNPATLGQVCLLHVKKNSMERIWRRSQVLKFFCYIGNLVNSRKYRPFVICLRAAEFGGLRNNSESAYTIPSIAKNGLID